jgi:hypothetical protein
VDYVSLCVLRGIIELWKKGVFAAAVIKKQKYWPKYVPGDAIDEKMEPAEVGDCTTRSLVSLKDFLMTCL